MLLKKPGQFAVGSATQSGAGLLDLNFLNSDATLSNTITHSRAGNATMVDSDGLLKWAPHNLFTYSEEFDNGNWTKSNTTVTGNTVVAPDGTLSGDKLIETTGSAFRAIRQTASSTDGTFSVYAKSAGDNRLLSLGVNTIDAHAVFDLDSGTVAGARGGSPTITHIGNGWYRCTLDTTGARTFFDIGLYPNDGTWNRFNYSNSYTGDGYSGIYIWGAHLYRSDLGGMVDVPAGERSFPSASTYVPTTSAARYLPRVGHHVYNGSAWVNEGVLAESEARTNLLLNSGTLATQNVTVTAVPHTLHFTGTGTVTLSGVSTAGPLVGTGTGENNRVFLTFTPTAGTLTLTVSGTVTNAQLEAAPTPSSYIPTAGATVTRAAETLTIPSANLPYSSTAMSIQMNGRATWVDEDAVAQVTFVRWVFDTANKIFAYIKSDGANIGKVFFEQEASNINDFVLSGEEYTPGILVPFNIASRHGMTFINGAVDGVALTANTTPTNLPDLSATDLELAYAYMGTVERFRVWGLDLGDGGIEGASS